MFNRSTLLLCIAALITSHAAFTQTVKGMVPEDAPPRVLTFHGLTPGKDLRANVHEALGEPAFESSWYSYKLYYPAKDRPGLYDVLHMGGGSEESHLANIDAASVPEGYETDAAIRAKLGQPEFELRMATWRMLDYTKEGLRFATNPQGNTIGVAYFHHTTTRVPEGERKLVDLSKLRQGPQPAPAKPADFSNIKVGVSEKIISPQHEDWLPYQFKIHDDLKVRIAVFKTADECVAFVGADNFGMGWKDVNPIRDRAKELGVNHLVFGMSHNHATGDTIGVYGHYPTEYIKYIQDQTVAGVEEALSELQAVKEIRTASQELPMDGIRVQDLFRNARNPGVLDPTIDIIQAIGTNGKPLTTMVHFACHVESLEKGAREISADFPGYMCDQIAKDGGGQPVFLNGALGGMVSGDNKARTHESAKEMGLQLAGIVKAMIPTAQPMTESTLTADQRLLHIPVTNKDFLERYETGMRSIARGAITTDMIYIKLGEAQFITLPGELLPEVSFEIFEHMQGFPRMLIGLANDQIGYMVPPYDFRADAYEESVSQGPATAVQVRDMAIRMLDGSR